MKGDFQSLLKSLPTKAIQDESLKLKRILDAKTQTNNKGDNCKKEVGDMKTIEQVCSVIVTLVTNAKLVKTDDAAKTRCYAILDALGEFKWTSLTTSKYFK